MSIIQFRYPMQVQLIDEDDISQYKMHQHIMLSIVNVFGTDIEIEYYGIRQKSNPTFVFKLHNYSMHKQHIMWWFEQIQCITYPEQIYGTDSAKICLI
jgi:hypothetical protein